MMIFAFLKKHPRTVIATIFIVVALAFVLAAIGVIFANNKEISVIKGILENGKPHHLAKRDVLLTLYSGNSTPELFEFRNLHHQPLFKSANSTLVRRIESTSGTHLSTSGVQFSPTTTKPPYVRETSSAQSVLGSGVSNHLHRHNHSSFSTAIPTSPTPSSPVYGSISASSSGTPSSRSRSKIPPRRSKRSTKNLPGDGTSLAELYVTAKCRESIDPTKLTEHLLELKLPGKKELREKFAYIKSRFTAKFVQNPKSYALRRGDTVFNDEGVIVHSLVDNPGNTYASVDDSTRYIVYTQEEVFATKKGGSTMFGIYPGHYPTEIFELVAFWRAVHRTKLTEEATYLFTKNEKKRKKRFLFGGGCASIGIISVGSCKKETAAYDDTKLRKEINDARKKDMAKVKKLIGKSTELAMKGIENLQKEQNIKWGAVEVEINRRNKLADSRYSEQKTESAFAILNALTNKWVLFLQSWKDLYQIHDLMWFLAQTAGSSSIDCGELPNNIIEPFRDAIREEDAVSATRCFPVYDQDQWTVFFHYYASLAPGSFCYLDTFLPNRNLNGIEPFSYIAAGGNFYILPSSSLSSPFDVSLSFLSEGLPAVLKLTAKNLPKSSGVYSLEIPPSTDLISYADQEYVHNVYEDVCIYVDIKTKKIKRQCVTENSAVFPSKKSTGAFIVGQLPSMGQGEMKDLVYKTRKLTSLTQDYGFANDTKGRYKQFKASLEAFKTTLISEAGVASVQTKENVITIVMMVLNFVATIALACYCGYLHYRLRQCCSSDYARIAQDDHVSPPNVIHKTISVNEEHQSVDLAIDSSGAGLEFLHGGGAVRKRISKKQLEKLISTGKMIYDGRSLLI